jgi:hypothetical protein
MLRRQTKGEAAGLWRTLLLLGFAGAFRRSELVALDASDLRTVLKIIISIRRSTPSGDVDNLGALFHSGRLDRVFNDLTSPSDERYRSATR